MLQLLCLIHYRVKDIGRHFHVYVSISTCNMYYIITNHNNVQINERLGTLSANFVYVRIVLSEFGGFLTCLHYSVEFRSAPINLLCV